MLLHKFDAKLSCVSRRLTIITTIATIITANTNTNNDITNTNTNTTTINITTITILILIIIIIIIIIIFHLPTLSCLPPRCNVRRDRRKGRRR